MPYKQIFQEQQWMIIIRLISSWRTLFDHQGIPQNQRFRVPHYDIEFLLKFTTALLVSLPPFLTCYLTLLVFHVRRVMKQGYPCCADDGSPYDLLDPLTLFPEVKYCSSRRGGIMHHFRPMQLAYNHY